MVSPELLLINIYLSKCCIRLSTNPYLVFTKYVHNYSFANFIQPITAANTTIEVNFPVGLFNSTNELKPCMKHGRKFSSNINNPLPSK